MGLGTVVFYDLILLILTRQSMCSDTYDIPVTINALIQDSVERSSMTTLFYKMDEDFYSNVTVTDAARNSEQSLESKVKKSISVVFLELASSHVSKTLTLSDLIYTTKSKWSYTVAVERIIEASEGTLKKLDDKVVIYKIQEYAMKTLEKRFQFASNEITSRLNLTIMEYYAVNETRWIEVVGIIVEKVISSRSEVLNLTTCYLANMMEKTVGEIQGFTLNEVDMYLYNTTMLLDKLPDYRTNVLSRLYQTFNITPSELARISNTDLSAINAMILIDVLQLFTQSVLKKLRVTKNEVIENDSSFDAKMLLSCTDKWEPFKVIIIPESFNNSAEAMAIEVGTLSSLIGLPYSDIQQLSIIEMIDLLENVIYPLSTDKKLVEMILLADVLKLYGIEEINKKENNVLDVIYKFTNFTQAQLTVLYGWNSSDYEFSSLFTLEEVDQVCANNSLEYELLALAKLTIGQVGDIQCQPFRESFKVMREIWEQKDLNFLEFKYSPNEQLSLDRPIADLVSELTKAPPMINYRVLNTTVESEELITKLSVNNITSVTTYSSDFLKTLSFQDIIGIILHLKRNGSLDYEIRVVSQTVITPLTPSSLITLTTSLIPLITSAKTSSTILSVMPTNVYTSKDSYRMTSQTSYTTIPSEKQPNVITSSNSDTQSSIYLELNSTSTLYVTKKSNMLINSQANTTILPKQTSIQYQILTSLTTEHLNTVSILPLESTMQSSTLDNIANHYTTSINYSHMKDMMNVSRSIIDQTQSKISTYYETKIATATKPSSAALYKKSNSYIETTQTDSLGKSTALMTSTFSDSFPNDESFVHSTTPSNSQRRSTEHLTTFSRLYSQEQHNSSIFSISATKTARFETQQTSSRYNVSELHTSSRINSPPVPIATLSTSQYLVQNTAITLISRLKLSYSLDSTVVQTKDYPRSTFLDQLPPSKTSLLSTGGSHSLAMPSSETTKLVTTRTSMIIDRTLLGNLTALRTSLTITSFTIVTKTMADTPKTSPADVSSKNTNLLSANSNSSHMASLIIQTSQIKSTIRTIAQSSIHLIKSISPTTELRNQKISSMKTTTQMLSMIQTSFTSTSKLSTESPSLSANLNQSSSIISPSSIEHPRSTMHQPKTRTSRVSSSVLRTPMILSPPTKVSTASLPTNMTSKPSSTKSAPFSTSIHKPEAVTCQQECRAHELCVTKSKNATCKVVKNLKGIFRIVNGANFSDELLDEKSNTFQTLAKQIEEMMDFIYENSQYKSNYVGTRVTKFEQGSVIVLCKLSLENTFALSADTVKELAQVLKNASPTYFTIDNSSVTLTDYDECSSGLITKCYRTATCNNTLGSYTCVCPEGMSGNGISCEVTNTTTSEDKEVPWIIYIVIAIMVVLIIFLVIVIIYCEKKHREKRRPRDLDLYKGSINMYPRSTSYLAETPESEADLADSLGIVNRHGPSLKMVTFNPTPEEKKEVELQNGQPGPVKSQAGIEFLG